MTLRQIEEISELAGYEHIHKGLTSRDLTKCEQLQIKQSMQLVRDRLVTVIVRLASLLFNTRKSPLLDVPIMSPHNSQHLENDLPI